MNAHGPVWSFPPSNGGPSRGFKDAGVATFSGKIMSSLVREICQNSLDAASDSCGKAVRVEFEKYDVPSRHIPGFEEIAAAVGRAFPHYRVQQNTEVLDHLKRMNHLLTRSEAIPVLRASDFNTTGLKGAYEDRFDDWNRLTKMDGGATKNGVSAGSYGIGKNAPFAASELRMVFYRTLTAESAHNGKAAQGVIHLPAHPQDVHREMTTMTAGIGYYGDPGNPDRPCEISNLPVPSIRLLDELCLRSDVGTDVFVIGLHEEENWRDSVAAEILESFLVAIHNGKLEVTLVDHADRMEITRDTLPAIVDRYRKSAKNAASYYEVLTDSDKVQCYDCSFHDMGVLHLRLLAAADRSLNRKVLVIRESNMRIRQIDRMPRGLQFSGILELTGQKLNEYFRALETPAHDAWEPDRYTANPKQAKEYVSELRRWVVQTVTNAAALTTTDQVRVTGLSDSLQTSDRTAADRSSGSSWEANSEPSVPKITVVQENTRSTPENIVVKRKGSHTASDGSADMLSGSGNSTRPRSRRRNRQRLGKNGSTGLHPGMADGSASKAVDGIFTRLVRTGPRSGRIVLEAPEPIERGAIMIQIVGENGRKYEALQVREVQSAHPDVRFHPSGSRIRFDSLPGAARVTADIVFSEPLSYAVGVSVYEDR